MLAVSCDKNGNSQGYSDVTNSGTFAILMNLVSPCLLGLCVTFLRRSTKEMILNEDECKYPVSALEFTAFKLFWSSLTVLPFAIAFEWYGLTLPHKMPLRDAIADIPTVVYGEIILGAVLVSILQVNITWLSSLTSAATLGVLASFKVLPQVISASIFDISNKVPALVCTPHIVGGAMIVLVSCAWAFVRLRGARDLLESKSKRVRKSWACSDEETGRLAATEASAESVDKLRDRMAFIRQTPRCDVPALPLILIFLREARPICYLDYINTFFSRDLPRILFFIVYTFTTA